MQSESIGIPDPTKASNFQLLRDQGMPENDLSPVTIGDLRLLGRAGSRAVAKVAALFMAAWTRQHPLEARLLLLHRRQIDALVGALLLGRRKGLKIPTSLPHNVPFTLLGAGLYMVGARAVEEASALAGTIPKYAENPQLLHPPR